MFDTEAGAQGLVVQEMSALEQQAGDRSRVRRTSSAGGDGLHQIILNGATTYLHLTNPGFWFSPSSVLFRAIAKGKVRSRWGDLDPTTSGLSHLPPSSKRMGHYLCVGVQDRMVIAL